MTGPKKEPSTIGFRSRVFPTPQDKALWESLSESEKYALVDHDERAGFESGIAEPESLAERLARVRAKLANAI